jgi:hypothetical protein
MVLFENNKRRGNLLWLDEYKGPFINIDKSSLLQVQCEEIASRMQNPLSELTRSSLLTEPRNDGYSVSVSISVVTMT